MTEKITLDKELERIKTSHSAEHLLNCAEFYYTTRDLPLWEACGKALLDHNINDVRVQHALTQPFT